MAERRVKDSLAAATTAHLLPALGPYGFRRRSARLVGRLGECAFQLLDFQKASFGGGNFCVNYASMLLVPPTDHVVLQPGDRLRSARGCDAWWPASSPEEADASMREVIERVAAQALPFFEATSSATGLYGHLAQASWGSQHHLELARGACAAWLGDRARAREHLCLATALYEEDGLDWCAQYREQALALLDAIAQGSHAALLRTWRAETVRGLKLGGLEGAPVAIQHRADPDER